MTTTDDLRRRAVRLFDEAGCRGPETWVDDIELDARKHGISAARRAWRSTIDDEADDGDEGYTAAIEAALEYAEEITR